MTFSNEINVPYLTREKLAARMKDAAGYINCGATTGTATAYTATSPTWITSYEDWQLFGVRLHTSSGASPTLTINGISAKPLVDPLDNAVTAGALSSGRLCLVAYDSTFDAFVLVNPPSYELVRYTSNSSSVSSTSSTSWASIGGLSISVAGVQTSDVLEVRCQANCSISDNTSTGLIAPELNGIPLDYVSRYSDDITGTGGNQNSLESTTTFTGYSGTVTVEMAHRMESGSTGFLYTGFKLLEVMHHKRR